MTLFQLLLLLGFQSVLLLQSLLGLHRELLLVIVAGPTIHHHVTTLSIHIIPVYVLRVEFDVAIELLSVNIQYPLIYICYIIMA